MPVEKRNFRAPGRMNAVARRALAAAVLLGASSAAWAGCRVDARHVAQNIIMDMGRVLMQPSLPVGSIIARKTVAIAAVPGVVTCNGALPNRRQAIGVLVHGGSPVAGFPNVYPTQIEGVGIRLYREAGTVSTYYPHVLQLPGNTTSANLNGGSFQIELVKTAERTGSGPIAPAGLYSSYYMSDDSPPRPLLISSVGGQGITIVTSTCEVNAGSRNIVVDFGAVPNTAFNGVGSKAADRDFAVNLTCQGGNVAEADQGLISVRIDAAQDASNLPGVLAITPGANAASRIGIELVDRLDGTDRAVVFGQGIELGRTAVNASKAFSLPLRARYVQTGGGAVGAGDANGTATFTIEYR